MPIDIFGKKYKTFAGAEKAAERKGKRNPAAYTATVARAQGDIPGKKRKKKKGT